jgi:adenylylsulfate kinase
MSDRRASNVSWHAGEVGESDRERLLGHGASCVWLTGLSGSGKSTIARRIERHAIERGVLAYVLDGDNIRHGLNRDLGFGPEARTENIRRIGEVARLFVDAGVLVITAFISPYRADRALVRALLPPERFVEVYVSTPLAVCEARDPKGLYRRARAGEIAEFTGIDSPYEAPEAPELTIDTSEAGVDACAERVLEWLALRGVVRATSETPRGTS